MFLYWHALPIDLHVPGSLSFRPELTGHLRGETSLTSQSQEYSYSPSYPLGIFSSQSLALSERILFIPGLRVVTHPTPMPVSMSPT